jgi:hypothetical protein
MSKITLAEQSSAPDSPSSGKLRIYADTNKRLNTKDSTGTVCAVGNVSTDVTQTFTKPQGASRTALTSTSNSIAVDLSLTPDYTHTFTENTTLANPTNTTSGQEGFFIWTQHASAAKTLAFGSAWVPFVGSMATLSTTTGAVNIMAYKVVDSTHIWYSWGNAGIA